MSALFFSLFLLLQGIPIQPTQGGTVTGLLRTADGKPAVGIRVGAVPQTDSAAEAAAGPTLSSIGETDAEGRYKLENVPPGRYYIAAGRLDLPTYYPGTQSMAVGQALRITAGATIQGIDFVLNATSLGRAEAAAFGITLLDLPLEVRIEGGGKLPVFSGGKRTMLQLTPVSGGTAISVALNASRASITPPLTDYRVTVDGLPEGYRVKSMKYGTADLAGGILKITGLNSSSLSPQTLTVLIDSSGATATRTTAPWVLGINRSSPLRALYLSGIPGTVFADGTFEFRNVAPGRHVIMTLDNAPSTAALAASVIVGNEDVNGVVAEKTPALPLNIRSRSSPVPISDHPSGPLPLASVRGRLLDGETGMPLNAGTVFLVGDSWAPCEIGADGTFEFQHLLPGSYELEVHGVGYTTFRRDVVMEEKDLELELKSN